MIKTIIFDLDGTLINTEEFVLSSLRDTVNAMKEKKVENEDLTPFLGVVSTKALKQLNIKEVEKAQELWHKNQQKYADSIRLFDTIENVLDDLKTKGYQLGIVTNKTRKEFKKDFAPFHLSHLFDQIICSDDIDNPKPHPDPLLKYLENARINREDALYIGDTIYDYQAAKRAGIPFGLAVWGSPSIKNIYADYFFKTPKEVPYTLSVLKNKKEDRPWVKHAMELQSLAQSGLAYSENSYDIERFERIREISAEMISRGSGYPKEYVKAIFCNEYGYQTPKLATRAAIFDKNKILLVKENNGTWALPGGWVDVYESLTSNTVKEVKEEAGLEVAPVKLIALHDRNQHNIPKYAHGVSIAFFHCKTIGGEFQKNIETIDSRYFKMDELPHLAEEKNTAEQIKMCFEASRHKDWEPFID